MSTLPTVESVTGGAQPPRAPRPVITVVADVDGNGVKAYHIYADITEVLNRLADGHFVRVEDDGRNMWINPSCVRYVTQGRVSLPVSASPSSISQSEHASVVSGTHQ
jgi:hypothetical protein